MAMPNDLPFENTPNVQQAMQWTLDDLLTLNPLTPELWNLIPPGNAMEAFQELKDAQANGEPGVRNVFRSLSNTDTYKWLKDLRNEPIPLRPGIESTEEEKEEDPRFKTGKNGKKVIVRTSEDEIDLLPDPECLIEDVFLMPSVNMIYGPAGTGKTFNALYIAYCVAHGKPWFEHPVKKGVVWYINTEGKYGLKPRTQALRKKHHLEKTSNIEFITWPVHLKEHSQELLNTVEEAEEKPKLLVVDNYSMCSTGISQNEQMEVTQTLMVLHEIAQKYNCTCLLVHHSNWTGKVNGSKAFMNHVDAMLDLSRPSKENPVIVLKCEKQRDMPEFPDIHLELEVIPLYAHPETGKTITSCVVVPSDAPIKEELNPKQRQSLDLLCDGMTFGDWNKLVEEHVSISRRTLERFRDFFEEKGLIERKANPGKYDTYYKKSPFSPFENKEDE